MGHHFVVIFEKFTMPITFACTCGKELRAPDGFEGRPARCPACGKDVTVPSSTAVSPARAAMPPPMASSAATAPPGWSAANGGPVKSKRNLAALAALLVSITALGVPLVMAIPGFFFEWWTSWIFGLATLLLTLFAAAAAIGLGIVALVAIKRSVGQLAGKGLAITGIIIGTVGPLLWMGCGGVGGVFALGISKSKEAAKRIESSSNMRQIGIALHNYHDTMNVFPTLAEGAGTPKKKLSWRVEILPYLEEQKLYEQFKMDEPWDSPNNVRLLPLMPKVYQCKRFPDAGPGMTYYQTFVGPNTVLNTVGGADLIAITNANGASQTLIVVEAGDPIPWTKPDDMPFDPKKPLPPLGGPKRVHFNALFADGHVQTLPQNINPQTLRLMIDWTNTQPFVMPY
jgi:prepilin-type processing-associated H-X9-DG protein